MLNRKTLTLLLWAACLLALGIAPLFGQTSTSTPRPRVQYSRLPLAFERRADLRHEQYVARGNGYTATLQGGNVRIGILATPGAEPNVISMQFVGGHPAPAKPGPELPGKVNYIRGRDPGAWQLGLPTYRRITYSGIYSNTDAVFYGNQEELEFDLVLRPGADPEQIRLKFTGARDLTLGKDGVLAVHTAAGRLRLPLPAIYQDAAGERRTIGGRYRLLAKNEVGFRVEGYDRRKPLVIDPSIVWAGYLGGGTNVSQASAVAVDALGNTYISGSTSASDFPTMNAAYPDMSGLPDGIVAKIDPTGTTLLYSTYIGGTGSTNLTGIAVASTGAAWVAGTSGAGFPSTAGAYQSTTGNGVVFKLDTNGTLLYSTYFAGGGSAIAVDPAGNAYVTGQATTGFAATAGAFQTAPQGLGDGYVAKFSPAGALIYATYMGGAGTDLLIAIAVDSGGNAYTTGYTTSPSFPGAPGGGAQTVNKGGCDGFVAKLNPSGTALSYFTFLGGSTYDAGRAIAVDSQGNAYVAGGTNSTDFPVTQGALQGTFGGGLSDSFVAKLNAAGSMFTYVTYLGGSRLESMRGIAIDGAGDAYVTGYSQSLNFPTLNPIQATQPDTQNVTALFQTTNSGSSWTPFDENISGIVSNVLPDPGTEGVIVALADSGVFRTTNGGTTWSQTFAAAANAESNYGNGSLSRSLADGNTIYFLYYTEILDGAASNSTIVYRSTDGGATWGLAGTVLPTTAIYPGIIAADPLNAGTAYIAGTASTVYQTTNGGATWTTLSTGLPDTNVVTLVPSPDGSIYMGTAAAAVYKSTNQGSTWTSVSSGLSGNGIANGLAVSPSNPAVLYWSNGSTTIYTTSNGGTSWAAVAGQLPSNVTSIVVAAFNASRVYVTLGSSSVVYVSTNGGSTWGGGNGNVGLATPNLVVVDPLRGGTLYAIAAIFPEATFVSEVNPGGSALVYSTYLSGSLLGTGNAIAAYGGDAIVAGAIAGLFPIATAWQTNSHTNTAFVARITGGAAPCTYTVSPLSQTIYSLAQSLVFDVGAPSGCPWTASSDQAFATVAGGASGTGSGFVYVTVPANNTGQMLSASLTIANQPVILTQTPSSCTYSLSPSSPYSVGSAGGQVQVNITTGATCPWTVANNYPFVLAVSASSGTGSGSTNLTVGPTTTGKSRSLFLTIGASSFTITQTGDPVLTVASSHTGNFIQGQSGATYSVTVSNASSAGATTSAVTVTETLPSGLSLVSMSGGGWSCTAGSNTCTRNDSLGAGTSYSAITVAVNVGTSAASPEVNVVTVSGGGGPPSAGSDVTTILGGSAGAPISTLNYARFHAASDPDVSYACQNTNGMACNGSALAPGTNWTVNYFSHATGNFGLLRGQSTVFLTGDDSLGGLQGIGSFPSLESTGARSSFRDGLTIAGGSGTGTLNLIFTVVGFGSATAGQLGASEFQYVPVVAGQPDRSLQASYGVVNGSATIPVPFTFGTPAEFEIDFYALAQIYSWVAGAAASADYSHTASLTAISAADSQGNPVPSFAIQSESGTNYSASGVSLSTPVLSIGSTHMGTFLLGQQNASYTVTVTNEKVAAPATGAITVTDTLPTGLSLASMTGSGWNCSGNSCTWNSALNPGASASPISVLVNVSASAPTQVFNLVTVSGGGSANASNSDPTAITVYSVCDVNQAGSTTVADVQNAINQALGAASAANDLNRDGLVNVVDVQIVLNAALSLGCTAAPVI